MLRDYGIHVTVVEPGPFRTDFLGGSLAHTKETLTDYQATAGGTRTYALERNGQQAGDPARAALAILQAVTSDHPPLHLLLGRLAYERANAKLDDLRKEFETWREVTLGADFST